jgi:hypothetical protein
VTRAGVTKPQIRVGGWWLSGIVQHWGGLKTSTRLRGDWEASWEVILPAGQRHPALVYGARVEVYLGPQRVFVGTLTEPDWDSGEMVAIGACREGESTPALTSGGVATTKPNTAVDAAITRGVLSWTRVGNFGTTAVGADDDQGGVYSVQSLLDAWAAEQDPTSGWRINRNRELTIEIPTETDPAWFVVPGSGEMGSADDDRVDRIFVRYVSSANGRLATASYPAASIAGGVEKTMDITDRGRKSSTQATNIAKSQWNKLQGRSGWTNGLTVTSGQVTTKGGVRADLALIRAGQSMRLLGVRDLRGLASNTDVIIGDTEYDWDEDTLQINPVGLAAGDVESSLEAVGEIAASAAKKAQATSALLSDLVVARGTATVSVSSAVFGDTAVSFPSGQFASAPIVVATVTDNNAYFASALSAATTGFTARAIHRDGTSATATVHVAWIAFAP